MVKIDKNGFGEKLYKFDSKGKTRVWFLEISRNKYRTHSGLLQEGAAIAVSGWVEAKPKNLGKVNETSAEQQALLEFQSKYTNKLDREYDLGSPKDYFKPMLAQTFPNKKKEQDKKEKWMKKYGRKNVGIQPKLDGIRCIINKDGMWSRKMQPIISAPHIFNAVSHIFEEYPELHIDGEIYNHEYREDFNKIISLSRRSKPTEEDLKESRDNLQYHIYDFFHKDKPDLQFYQRYDVELYKKIAKENTDIILLVYTAYIGLDEDALSELSKSFINEGYEGVMVRILHMPYEQKRSNGLWKYKLFEDDEFTVRDIVDGMGDWSGRAKSVILEEKTKDGSKHLGCGVSGDYDYCQELFENRKEYIGGEVTVRYQGYTSDGNLRFGVAKAFHKNKREI